MKLFTKELVKALAENTEQKVPVGKWFNPTGAGTWLLVGFDDPADATKPFDDIEVLWAICDLGMDCVEFGTLYVPELRDFKGRFGLGIERDLHWTNKKHANGEPWTVADYIKLDCLS